MKSIILTFFGLLISVLIFAQAPQAFNYQGVARDLSGNPIPNQNIGLQIAIIQGSPTGTEVYKETHVTTTTSLGLFNLQIGGGVIVNGDFESIAWSADSHFLQIEMDENGGSNFELVGSSQLLSVPYALSAGNAYWDKEDSFPVYQLPNSNDETKVTIAVPDALGNLGMLLNNEEEEKAAYIDFNMGGGDREARIIYNYPDNNGNLGMYVGSSTNNQEGITINEEGNVGIGTVNPRAKLDIQGVSGDKLLGLPAGWELEFFSGINSVYNQNITNPDHEVFFLKSEEGSFAEFIMFGEGENRLSIYNRDNTNTYNPYFNVKQNGNVGIGTFSPKSKLQISNGDIYIENVNNGVIMKSPNGQCWRMTVTNFGQPEFNAVTCPN